MNKRIFSAVFVLALLFSAVAGTQIVNLAAANFIHGPAPTWVGIYIKSDGSVEPSTTAIKRVGDVYALTGNILGNSTHVYSIVINRDNIVIDGAGFTLRSTQTWGIDLTGRNNITIKNITITHFSGGILASNSSQIFIIGNNITQNSVGIQLNNSSESIVTQNDISNNNVGIQLHSSSDCVITQNDLSDDQQVMSIVESRNNRISENEMAWSLGQHELFSPKGVTFINSSKNIFNDNNITNQSKGISFTNSSNNIICHNNFVNNQVQVDDAYADERRHWLPPYLQSFSVNAWDNGEEGNYWSDYTGNDPNHNGIGDSAYIINANNTDRYPLMEPATKPIAIPEFPTEDKTTSTIEPLPTTLIAASVSVAVAGAGLIFYFKKRSH
jgi:parallel beta-helix repeat protein